MQSSYQWKVEENGVFTLYLGNAPILSASAQATEEESGTIVDTRKAALVACEESDGVLVLTYEDETGYVLKEYLGVDGGIATAQCSLSHKGGGVIRTNALTPLIAHGKEDETPYLWRDLGAKLLLVPYDNDMWMRYEAVAWRAGRKSYDLTVLFKEDSREGLLIGAMDFAQWKNAIACPFMDARILEARCGQGASGEGTHDIEAHGVIDGREVRSSRFMILYGPDYRDLLETYADKLSATHPPRRWSKGVPFGFNSYAGLGRKLNAENFRLTGDFIHKQLMPRGFENNGQTTINMDGGWQWFFKEDEMLKIKDELHEKGQLAGIYDGPFACFMPNLDAEIPMMPGHTFSQIVLRDRKGDPLPRVDRAVPLDVTHPIWLEWTKKKAKQFVDWGYDYLKIDFLSHAGMEGVHYDKSIHTGREALNYGYKVLADCFDEKKIGRPFFLSLSIAPLFPYGYGNARRFSCDAFGLSEDIEYVLNAQTYSWWTSGRLYQFNDPDHIVLRRSFCMLEDSTEGEARARYTSAVISGSVMLLSDDYTVPGTMERTVKIAGNAAVNEIAKIGVAFRPVDSAGTSAAQVYTATIDGTQFAAIFAFSRRPNTVTVDLTRANLDEGEWEELWTGKRTHAKDGRLCWNFEGTDAALLRKL